MVVVVVLVLVVVVTYLRTELFCVCASSTVSSRGVTKAQLASRGSDVAVTVGRAADTVDQPPAAADKSLSEKAAVAGDISSTSETTMRRKREFLTSVVTQEQHETSVAATMMPFRCWFMRVTG